VVKLRDFLSPPHHGPISIPFHVIRETPATAVYTHFPIVQTARYAVFVATPDVVVQQLHYPGRNQASGTGTVVPIAPVEAGPPFKVGYVTQEPIIFSKDDPEPIAIQFDVKDKEAIEYIVVVYVD